MKAMIRTGAGFFLPEKWPTAMVTRSRLSGEDIATLNSRDAHQWQSAAIQSRTCTALTSDYTSYVMIRCLWHFVVAAAAASARHHFVDEFNGACVEETGLDARWHYSRNGFQTFVVRMK